VDEKIRQFFHLSVALGKDEDIIDNLVVCNHDQGISTML
jgi:hypothetical protein